MIRIEAYFHHSSYSLITLTKCNRIEDLEETILQMCEIYDEDVKDIKKIFIFIEGEKENEKN